MLDPGFGFGKNYEENYPLLARFEEVRRADQLDETAAEMLERTYI